MLWLKMHWWRRVRTLSWLAIEMNKTALDTSCSAVWSALVECPKEDKRLTESTDTWVTPWHGSLRQTNVRSIWSNTRRCLRSSGSSRSIVVYGMDIMETAHVKIPLRWIGFMQGCNLVFSSGCDKLGIKNFGNLGSRFELTLKPSLKKLLPLKPYFRTSSSSHPIAKMAGSRFVVDIVYPTEQTGYTLGFMRRSCRCHLTQTRKVLEHRMSPSIFAMHYATSRSLRDRRNKQAMRRLIWVHEDWR